MLRPGTLALTTMLAAMTAIAPLSTDMYLPSLPEIARLLDATPAQVQLTLSSYLAGYAVGQIVYGPLADHYGRKPVLLAALGLFATASLACALSVSIEILIAARFAQAFGGCGGVVLARAIVRDLYSGPRAARELSLMGAITAIAPITAPLAGGLLQTFAGWRATFVALLAFGIGVVVLMWRLLPETLRTPTPEPIGLRALLRSFRTFTADRAFLAHLGIVAFSYAGLFAWLSGASFVLQDLYGLSPIGFALAFTVGSIGYMAGAALAARFVMRMGLDRTIGVGTGALAAGGVAMLASLALGIGSPAAIVLPVAVFLAGLGLAMPQAIAGALQPYPERAGSASSLLGVVQQTLAAVIGALVGHLLGQTAWPMALAIAAMGAASLLVWALSRRARRLGPARPAG